MLANSTGFWALLLSASMLALFSSACLESHADVRLSKSDEELAKNVIRTNECGLCHTLQARGLNLTGKIGPDLTQQALRDRSPQWLQGQLTNPVSIPDHEVVPGFEGKQNLMPRFNRTSERDLNAVIEFLRSLNSVHHPADDADRIQISSGRPDPTKFSFAH